MTKTVKRLALAAGLALALTAPALAGSIKIGFNVPLTGFAAADGNSALTGAQLAVEQVNGAGGINGDMLELVVYDDQASPKAAAPLAVKLTTQDEVAAGISGSYSGAPGQRRRSSRRTASPTSRPTPSTRTSPARATMSSVPPSWARSRAVPGPS